MNRGHVAQMFPVSLFCELLFIHCARDFSSCLRSTSTPTNRRDLHRPQTFLHISTFAQRAHHPTQCSASAESILHHRSGQSLRARHIHRLYITVQLLFGTLLVITFPGDTDTQAVWDTFDARFPHFLVELWVKTHIFRSLCEVILWLDAVRVSAEGRKSESEQKGVQKLIQQKGMLLEGREYRTYH